MSAFKTVSVSPLDLEKGSQLLSCVYDSRAAAVSTVSSGENASGTVKSVRIKMWETSLH